jgi:hypothetical protein
MKRICAGLAVAALMAFGDGAVIAPANAAPPTVTPSPGYDARLQEQHAAGRIYEPVVRHPRPVSRHHARRVHGDAR